MSPMNQCKDDHWEQYITSKHRVGSRETCDPAPVDTDEDWLLYVDKKDYNTFCFLTKEKFLQVSEEGYENADGSVSPFTTFRSYHGSTDVNLIVSSDGEFIARFLLATKVAKKLNLLKKSDRITLFEAILYGEVDGGCIHEPEKTPKTSQEKPSSCPSKN